MTDQETSVLIVGGGGCGLMAAVILADLGVDCVLVERHDSTSNVPKAHGHSQRTMEIFRQHGIADDVFAIGAPRSHMSRVVYATSLGGDTDIDRKTLFSVDAWGGNTLADRYEADSPVSWTDLPQSRLEPILRRHAEERNPGGVRFGVELLTFTCDSHGITATLRDRSTNEESTVRARYLLGADGGKTIGGLLGIGMVGQTELLDMVTAHFTADLSPWMPDDDRLQTWFCNANTSGVWSTGVIGPRGPHHWGAQSEEWAVHFSMSVEEGRHFDPATIAARVRELLGIPDLELDVLSVNHWLLEALHAPRLHVDRVFLAGDAAHRHPPTTGLGLNSAFQDVHNLGWKLAAVLHGYAGDALLDTYEEERLPVIRENIDWSLMTFNNHSVIPVVLGFVPGHPTHNAAALRTLFAPGRDGASRRALVTEVATSVLRREFQAHDVDLGYVYTDGALVPDGTPAPPRDPAGLDYRPTTRPGHRLPHAWLHTDQGRISTHDLLGRGRFLLIVSSGGEPWEHAAHKCIANLGVPIHCVRISRSGAFADSDGHWEKVRQVSDDGAILVRPDGHIGWRADALPTEPDAALHRAMQSLLRRP